VARADRRGGIARRSGPAATLSGTAVMCVRIEFYFRVRT
jgi:hypothetical protein